MDTLRNIVTAENIIGLANRRKTKQANKRMRKIVK